MRRLPTAALAVAAAIFVVDQVVKYWITGVLDLDYLSATREVTGFFRFTFVPNCGVSLGLLGAHTDTPVVRWGVTLVTSAIAGAVCFWLWRERNAVDRVALGCVLGGALGNIADRLIPADTFAKVTAGAVRYPGCVIDYADLHIGEWRPFLVFNIADAAITLGVLVLLMRALLGGSRQRSVEIGNA
jgi:signal peptidase II